MNWTRKFFKKHYTLFKNNEQIGSIKRKFLASDSECLINESAYNFKRIGFIKHKFVVSSTKESHIAEITFKRLWTKATITFNNGARHYWEVNKLWGHFWSIDHKSETQIKFVETFLRGNVVGDVSNEILVLAGLIVKVYFKRAIIFLSLGAALLSSLIYV